ncbi:MAG: class I SAM-dependent methyltransferase [Anaerolineae bacterium]|nr:class I SAM-dependent methyltransferase [Anaerolineae bacterium]
MRLSDREFKGMNNAFRSFIQRRVEFPLFQGMGLTQRGLDMLEIGCGSGYGATLLARLEPTSYTGIDLMPEQIALALKRNLPGAVFRVQDATDLSDIPDASKDVVVVFGVLHHIPPWRAVLDEVYRVLRPGGRLFIEEPDGGAITFFDCLFHWGHPGGFRLKEFEAYLEAIGFTICQRRRIFVGFATYCVQKPPTAA